jgi:RHS repeat-associated protein
MTGRSYLSGVGAKEGYTGKERDAETGLDYFGARYYLGAIGRWGGVDALTDQYPSWSPYTYVLNSPLRLVDPDGREIDVSELEATKEGRDLLNKILADWEAFTGVRFKVENGKITAGQLLTTDKVSEKVKDFILEAIGSSISLKLSYSTSYEYEDDRGSSADAEINAIHLNAGQLEWNENNTQRGLSQNANGYGMALIHEIIHTRIGQKYFGVSDLIVDHPGQGPWIYDYENILRQDLMNAGTNIGIALGHSPVQTKRAGSLVYGYAFTNNDGKVRHVYAKSLRYRN